MFPFIRWSRWLQPPSRLDSADWLRLEADDAERRLLRRGERPGRLSIDPPSVPPRFR